MISTGKTGKTVFSRLLEGEDLFESVKNRAETSGIRAGFFILIGTVKHSVLGYYKDGKYEPPHSITPLDHLIHSDHTIDKMEKDNDEYDAGYSNARKQS